MDDSNAGNELEDGENSDDSEEPDDDDNSDRAQRVRRWFKIQTSKQRLVGYQQQFKRRQQLTR